MTDKTITVDVIKEISSQLQLLYGHATNDILPIVLHAIQMRAIFDTLGSIAAIIVVLLLIKFMWIPGIKRSREEFNDNEEFIPFVRYVGMGIATLSAPFFIGCMIERMVYIISPEVLIIKNIIGGL